MAYLTGSGVLDETLLAPSGRLTTNLTREPSWGSPSVALKRYSMQEEQPEEGAYKVCARKVDWRVSSGSAALPARHDHGIRART